MFPSHQISASQSRRWSSRSSEQIGISISGKHSSERVLSFSLQLAKTFHDRDANISHIASGFVYNSPSQRKVRVDEAYDSTFGSSLFDYNNVTQEGVANRLWTLSPAITSPPACFEGFANPAFPLISEDFLVANNAIYGGEMYDALAGKVSSVSCTGSSIPQSKCHSF